MLSASLEDSAFAIWYGMFFVAHSMGLVYLGTVNGGIFVGGAISVATAYASDVAGREKTGGAIAKMQAAQMVGALLPTLAAGYLAEVNPHLHFGILAAIARRGFGCLGSQRRCCCQVSRDALVSMIGWIGLIVY